MVEQAIYFALGCVVTALLALLFAPVFWRRALRLTRQRLQLQVPLSMQEILAERDQLRASFAVERLRLEQRMERIQATKTRDLIEIGRRTMDAGALSDEVSALRRLEQAQQTEIDLLLQEAVQLGAEKSSLQIALHESETKAEQARGQAETARQSHKTLQDELAVHRATIASLRSRVTGLNLPLVDSEEAHAAGERTVEETLRNHLEAAMSQSARHEMASVSLKHDLDAAKAQIRRLEAQLSVKTKDPSNEAAAKESAGDESAEGDRELRNSIHALGEAVAKLTRQSREGEAEANQAKAATAPRPVNVA